MPQRPTTHKDLHRTVIGLVLALLYCSEMQAAGAQTPAKLVKKEPVKAPTSPLKPLSAPAEPPAVPSAKGRLREIPLSTLSGETAPVKPAQKAEAREGRKTEDKPAGNKNGSSSKPKRTASVTPRMHNGLVPPPPPVVPIGMDALGMYAQPVDFLSLKELEGRKTELTARFNELQSIVGDGNRQIRERKERADLFESLYQEGVVSRKELETARREAGEIDRDLKFKQDELESVKISMKAVNNRLAVMKKAQEKLNAGKKGTITPSAKKVQKSR